MNIDKIIEEHHFDSASFKKFILESSYSYYKTFSGDIEIEDKDLEQAISDFSSIHAQQQEQAEKDKQAEADRLADMRQKLPQMLITSGFNFDGYRIKKYSGYISGDGVLQIARGVGGLFSDATNVGNALTGSLAQIRREALQKLKEAAYDLGCNAVIGVDFDYITMDPQTATLTGRTEYLPYVFCVTANGNAVIIEKSDN